MVELLGVGVVEEGAWLHQLDLAVGEEEEPELMKMDDQREGVEVQ